MTTAASDTGAITLPTERADANGTPPQKRDPYVINIPEMRTRPARIIWSLGEVMLLASVVIVGLCLMGVFLGASATDPQTAVLGDFSVRLLPYGFGAFVASFALRGWRHRVDKRDSTATQGLEMVVAAFASIGVGFVVKTVTAYAIMLLALFIR